MSAQASLINVVINSPSPENVYNGTTSELKVIVTNRNPQGILLEVYVNLPSLLSNWCKNTRFSFNLDSEKTQQVVFKWEVPIQAIPAIYNYEVIIDSPNHLKAPIRYQRQLQILPQLQQAYQAQEPIIGLNPSTSSTAPLILQPGERTEIKILVENRSLQIDQFRLSCDLDPEWFTFVYPEEIQQQGLISNGASLNLLAGKQGEITLCLHPPKNSLAGNYRPDIIVFSAAKPNLSLKKILYFYLAPIFNLQVEIYSILNKVKQKPGEYKIELINNGNTTRQLALTVETCDEEELCDYDYDRSPLKILPNTSAIVPLKVKPKQKKTRGFFKTKLFNFKVEFEDLNQNILPKNLPLKGTLLWLPRPWWQWLSLILLSLLTLAGIVFLLLQLFKPAAPPKINNFTTTSDNNTYNYGDAIALTWNVENASQIKTLILKGDLDSKPAIEPKEYNFIDGIPSELENLCDNTNNILQCKNIKTEAKKPGNYLFDLKVVGKNNSPEASTKLEATVLERPLPKIINIKTDKQTYKTGEPIKLDFTVQNYQEAKKIILKNNQEEKEIKLQQMSSICAEESDNIHKCSLTTPSSKDGEYLLGIKIFNKDSGYKVEKEPSEMQATPIKVQTPLEFVMFKINGYDIAPINLKAEQKPIIEWEVKGKDVKVSIDYVTKNLPSKGIIALNQFSKPGTYEISLKATDAYGETMEKKLVVNVPEELKPEDLLEQKQKEKCLDEQCSNLIDDKKNQHEQNKN